MLQLPGFTIDPLLFTLTVYFMINLAQGFNSIFLTCLLSVLVFNTSATFGKKIYFCNRLYILSSLLVQVWITEFSYIYRSVYVIESAKIANNWSCDHSHIKCINFLFWSICKIIVSIFIYKFLWILSELVVHVEEKRLMRIAFVHIWAYSPFKMRNSRCNQPHRSLYIVFW